VIVTPAPAVPGGIVGQARRYGRVGKQDDIPLRVRPFRGTGLFGCGWPARMMDRQPQPGAAGDPRSLRTPDLFGFLSPDTPGKANLKTEGPYSPRMTHDHPNARDLGWAEQDRRGVFRSSRGRFPVLTHDHSRPALRASLPSRDARQNHKCGTGMSAGGGRLGGWQEKGQECLAAVGR
jgi:hypothetical protein